MKKTTFLHHSPIICAGMFIAAHASAVPQLTVTEVSRTTVPYYNNMTLPTADLTALGPSDWCVWDWSGNAIVEINGKSGVSLIGPVADAFDSDAQAVSTKVVARFSFTDGTSPASGSNVDAGAGWTRSDWSSNSAQSSVVPTLTLSIPASSVIHTLCLWATGYKGDYLRLRVFDGSGTQVGTTTDGLVSGTGSNGFAAFCYKLEYGGAAASETWTVRLDLVAPEQDDAFLELEAAALMLPPPRGTIIVVQ